MRAAIKEDDESLPSSKISASEGIKALNTAIRRAENNAGNCEEIMWPRRLRVKAFDKHIGTSVKKNLSILNEYVYTYFNILIIIILIVIVFL